NGVESNAVKTVVTKGTDVVVETMGMTFGTAGGNFVGGVYGALQDGKHMHEALDAGRKAADEAFKPEAILTTAAISTAGQIAHGSQPHEGQPHEGGTGE